MPNEREKEIIATYRDFVKQAGLNRADYGIPTKGGWIGIGLDWQAQNVDWYQWAREGFAPGFIEAYPAIVQEVKTRAGNDPRSEVPPADLEEEPPVDVDLEKVAIELEFGDPGYILKPGDTGYKPPREPWTDADSERVRKDLTGIGKAETEFVNAVIARAKAAYEEPGSLWTKDSAISSTIEYYIAIRGIGKGVTIERTERRVEPVPGLGMMSVPYTIYSDGREIGNYVQATPLERGGHIDPATVEWDKYIAAGLSPESIELAKQIYAADESLTPLDAIMWADDRLAKASQDIAGTGTQKIVHKTIEGVGDAVFIYEVFPSGKQVLRSTMWKDPQTQVYTRRYYDDDTGRQMAQEGTMSAEGVFTSAGDAYPTTEGNLTSIEPIEEWSVKDKAFRTQFYKVNTRTGERTPVGESWLSSRPDEEKPTYISRPNGVQVINPDGTVGDFIPDTPAPGSVSEEEQWKWTQEQARLDREYQQTKDKRQAWLDSSQLALEQSRMGLSAWQTEKARQQSAELTRENIAAGLGPRDWLQKWQLSGNVGLPHPGEVGAGWLGMLGVDVEKAQEVWAQNAEWRAEAEKRRQQQAADESNYLSTLEKYYQAQMKLSEYERRRAADAQWDWWGNQTDPSAWGNQIDPTTGMSNWQAYLTKTYGEMPTPGQMPTPPIGQQGVGAPLTNWISDPRFRAQLAGPQTWSNMGWENRQKAGGLWEMQGYGGQQAQAGMIGTPGQGYWAGVTSAPLAKGRKVRV